MSELDNVEVYFGPDNDREIALKRELAALQERYRQEAKPIIDALVEERSFKVPRIFLRTTANKSEDVA